MVPSGWLPSTKYQVPKTHLPATRFVGEGGIAICHVKGGKGRLHNCKPRLCNRPTVSTILLACGPDQGKCPCTTDETTHLLPVWRLKGLCECHRSHVSNCCEAPCMRRHCGVPTTRPHMGWPRGRGGEAAAAWARTLGRPPGCCAPTCCAAPTSSARSPLRRTAAAPHRARPQQWGPAAAAEQSPWWCCNVKRPWQW